MLSHQSPARRGWQGRTLVSQLQPPIENATAAARDRRGRAGRTISSLTSIPTTNSHLSTPSPSLSRLSTSSGSSCFFSSTAWREHAKTPEKRLSDAREERGRRFPRCEAAFGRSCTPPCECGWYEVADILRRRHVRVAPGGCTARRPCRASSAGCRESGLNPECLLPPRHGCPSPRRPCCSARCKLFKNRCECPSRVE